MKYSVKSYLTEGADLDFSIVDIPNSTLRRVSNTNMVLNSVSRLETELFIGDWKRPDSLNKVATFKGMKEFKQILAKKKATLKRFGVEFQKLQKCQWHFVSNTRGGKDMRSIDVLKCDVHNHTKQVWTDSGKKVR